MPPKFLTSILMIIASLGCLSQSLDFGVEVQQNNNLVQKWQIDKILTEANSDFWMRDVNGDTLNLHFTTFSMSNNFEIPLYFRFNLKHRWFADFKLSNVSHTLNMEGVANYNEGFFNSNYGTYNDFLSQAQSAGFDTVDYTDYTNYINNAKVQFQTNVRSREEFKLLSLSANVGVRLLPHRSLKPYLTVGFSFKSRYQKFTYQHLDFSNPNIYNYELVNQGVNKFAERTTYFNFGAGIEFYRFRAGVYYQTGSRLQPTNGTTNHVVVRVNPLTPFSRIHSYGFSLCANLFSAEFGKRIIYEDLGEDEMVLSNAEKRKFKKDFALRFNRRVFNNVSTFYADPANRLSLLSRDSILVNNGGNIMSAERIELTRLGDVKRIFWSGQIDFVFTRYIGNRLSLEWLFGFSSLTTDIETSELVATILHDSVAGNSIWLTSTEPRIRSGVYRSMFNTSTFALAIGFDIIDNDLFELKVFAGSGFTTLISRPLTFADLPDGVNSLGIYDYLNDGNLANDQQIYAHQGPVNVDLVTSPDELFEDFGSTTLNNWSRPKDERSTFPMMRGGFEVIIDRFTLGLSFESSINYMDGFLLNEYSSAYFSVGYKLSRRYAKEKKVKTPGNNK